MRHDRKNAILQQLAKAGAIEIDDCGDNSCSHIDICQVFEPGTNCVTELDNGKFLLIANLSISHQDCERLTVDACDLITSWGEVAKLQPDPIHIKGARPLYGARELAFDREEVINHLISPGRHLPGFDHELRGLLLAEVEHCPLADLCRPISANFRMIFSNGTKVDFTLTLGNTNIAAPKRPVARKRTRASIFENGVRPEHREGDSGGEPYAAKQKRLD